MAFEKEIKEYEDLRGKYQTLIINKMDREEYIKYNEVLFSTYSCAIEGNSFSVDDTRELKEKGLGMIPAGKTLFEAFEMLDHFEAFEYMMQNTQHPLDENLLKEINRRVTCHTLSYRSPEAIPGEYTTTDMAAGDTVFGRSRRTHRQNSQAVGIYRKSHRFGCRSSHDSCRPLPWLLRISSSVP